MLLGACRLTKRILVLVVGLWASLSLTACGSGGTKTGPPSNLPERVLASQGVTTNVTFGGLITIDGQNDTLPRLAPLGGGTSPGLMAISPSRRVVAAFDSITQTVYANDTTSESLIGRVPINGWTQSMVIPTSSPVGYAAVPGVTVNGYSFAGAVQVMNFATNSALTIAVPSAQWVFSNSTGTQLLVFSSDSDAITVLTPSIAVPPVDTSCLPSGNPPNAVCIIVRDPRLSRPAFAIINGNTAYVLNCGFECGGTQQASVAIFDLNSLTVTATIPVNGATDALLNGSTLYVAGNGTPTGPLCSSLTNSINPPTAATYCGTLDIVNLNTLTDPYFNNPAMEIAIPDGYHDRMDFTNDGQLFVGSYACTNIGNINNPVGEVRGCLAIYNSITNAVVIPPDNGDVDGLQGFTTRYIEYVAEGGNLRVYNTRLDILYINSVLLPLGSIDIIGYVGDVKAIDFF
jgi:hypothetical protein